MNPSAPTLLAALLALAPRDVAAGPPQSLGEPPEERGAAVDGVVAVVGEEVITFSELRYAVMRAARSGAKADPETILNEQVRRLMKTQAGQDMGYDPELVEELLQGRMEWIVDKQGGAVKASTWLRDAVGMRPDELEDYYRRELYAQSYEGALTGTQPGVDGRVGVDRYIRPGQRHAAYELIATSADPAEREKIGAVPERVVLQELILPLDTHGGQRATIELATALRDAALGGEDFGQLVLLHGAAKENRGLTAPLPVPSLVQVSANRHGTDELARFAGDADVGAVSEPLVGGALNSERQAVFVYRLDQRIPAEPPRPYVSRETQKVLTEDLEKALDRLRLAVGMERLRETIYVWLPAGAADGGPPTRSQALAPPAR